MSTGTDEDSRQMKFELLTHPDRKKDFAATLRHANDERSETKERRAASIWKCSNPRCSDTSRGEKGLQACSKCKLARYCSRECQREDWRVHKQTCGSPMSPPDLVKNVLASNLLQHFLLSYAALELDILAPGANPQKPASHAIIVEVCMSPVDLPEYFDAVQVGRDPTSENQRGVLHVRRVYKQPAKAVLDQAMEEILAKAIRQRDIYEPNVYIFPVHFTVDGKRGSVFHVLAIPPEILNFVKAARPYPVKSQLRGVHEIPCNKDGILQVLNMTMRNDKENRLKVRAKLTPKDVEVMRDLFPPFGIPPTLINFVKMQ